MKRLVPLALCAAVALMPSASFAWGGAGHRMVGLAAMRALPANLPAFLKTPQVIEDVGEFSRELDRSKGAGKLHDTDREPYHFIDIHDDGSVLLGPPLSPMPGTRAEYETQLGAKNLQIEKAGYLQFGIVDRWQQLTTDFAYFRVLQAAEKNPAWKANRAWFKADKRRREVLILHAIGDLSHLVGDGSQPLHASTHYNGWGDYPNPEGFTQARIHSMFEGALVRNGVKMPAVEAAMVAPRDCACAIEQRVVDYLMATSKTVTPLYELEKVGGLTQGDPRGPKFAAERMGVGASELRDLIALAWTASANSKVGWRPIAVQDVLAGKVDPYPALYSID